MPSRSAVVRAQHDGRELAVAPFSHAAGRHLAPSAASRSRSAAATLRPPVRARSMLAAVDEDVVQRGASRRAAPRRSVPPGATVSVGRVARCTEQIVPAGHGQQVGAERGELGLISAWLDDEMPTTAIIAAMPIAMPRADRTARVGRARRPVVPSRSRSDRGAATVGRGRGSCGPRSRGHRRSLTIRPSRIATCAGESRREPGVVRDHDDGGAGLVEFVQQSHDARAGHGVQVAGGLVGEEQRRVADHGAGDRDPLALTAGELVSGGGRDGGRGRRVRGRSTARRRRSPGGPRRRAGRRRRCRARSTPSARWNCWKTKPMRYARSAESFASERRPTSWPAMRCGPSRSAGRGCR